MTDVVPISSVEHELAKLMVEYGPRWGKEVNPAIVAMATAEEVPAASANEGMKTSPPVAPKRLGSPVDDVELIDMVRQLRNLREGGILNDEEYAGARTKLTSASDEEIDAVTADLSARGLLERRLPKLPPVFESAEEVAAIER